VHARPGANARDHTPVTGHGENGRGSRCIERGLRPARTATRPRPPTDR
jgi:hypothetical protein